MRRSTHSAISGTVEPVSIIRRAQRLAELTGDFPLEVGLAAWATVVGLTTLLWDPPSSSLARLPHALDTTWGIALLVGAAATGYGLWARNFSAAISNAMFLFAIAFAVYSVTVTSISGWTSGGAVSGLTMTLAVVCYLRSRRLRELWKILLAEGRRLNEPPGESGGS